MWKAKEREESRVMYRFAGLGNRADGGEAAECRDSTGEDEALCFSLK